jgi:very-short-patch-repair endonuclease
VSAGEDEMALHLRAYGIPFEREYRFHPERRWRLDFALVEHRIGIEIEGGIWKRGGGGHSHPMHIEKDIEKSNALALLGWRLFRFMPDKDVSSGRAIECIVRALAEKA